MAVVSVLKGEKWTCAVLGYDRVLLPPPPPPVKACAIIPVYISNLIQIDQDTSTHNPLSPPWGEETVDF